MTSNYRPVLEIHWIHVAHLREQKLGHTSRQGSCTQTQTQKNLIFSKTAPTWLQWTELGSLFLTMQTVGVGPIEDSTVNIYLPKNRKQKQKLNTLLIDCMFKYLPI